MSVMSRSEMNGIVYTALAIYGKWLVLFRSGVGLYVDGVAAGMMGEVGLLLTGRRFSNDVNSSCVILNAYGKLRAIDGLFNNRLSSHGGGKQL